MNTPFVREGALRAPPAAGLETIELANADLADSCTWTPPAPRTTVAPLPIYPTPADLAIEIRRT